MALQVEDGTGLTDADAYVDAAYVTAYFTKRGVETWTDQDEVTQESAIIRATAALDQKYRDAWKGVRKTAGQSLAWPRIAEKDTEELIVDDEGYDVASDAVPRQVQDATAEVALIELTQRYVTQEVTAGDRVKKEKIGPLETEYFDDATSTTLYPHIDGILDSITTGSASSGTQMEVLLTTDELDQLSGDDDWLTSEYFNIIK